MSQSCLIGYTGFVGSNLCQQRSFDDLYRSTNIGEIDGKSYDLLICSGVSAAKWKANQAPDEDRAAIDKLLKHLLTVKVDRFVLISTVDVYPVATNVDESYNCHGKENHAYGTNRLYLEQALQAAFAGLFVIRLPGLFGPGLKKNVIYDLLHNNCLAAINPASVFQYYDMTAISKDVDTVLNSGATLVNLVTEPIATGIIHRELFPNARIGDQPSVAASYDIHTRHAGIFGKTGHYRFSSQEVLDRLRRFTEGARQDQEP